MTSGSSGELQHITHDLLPWRQRMVTVATKMSLFSTASFSMIPNHGNAKLQELVSSTFFQSLVPFVIVVNAFFIGWQADRAMQDQRARLEGIPYEDATIAGSAVFCLFFFAELVVR